MRGRKQSLLARAQWLGLHVQTWSPGDGVTRYRFTIMGRPDITIRSRYSLGIREAEEFLDGFEAGIIVSYPPAGKLGEAWSEAHEAERARHRAALGIITEEAY